MQQVDKPEEILKLARISKGLTQTQMGEMVGLKLRAYQRLENGDFPAFKSESIEQLDKILGTNLYDIIYAKKRNTYTSVVALHNANGVTLLNEPIANYLENRRKLKLNKPIDNVDVIPSGVPVYDAVIDASFIERYNDTSLYTPIYYIDIPRLRNCDFAVFVKGSSMYPLMKSGTVAFIRVVDRFDYFDEGEMYFISTTNGFETVKYVQHGDQPDELKLIPHNDKIKAATIKKNMVIKMCIVEAWLNFR